MFFCNPEFAFLAYEPKFTQPLWSCVLGCCENLPFHLISRTEPQEGLYDAPTVKCPSLIQHHLVIFRLPFEPFGALALLRSGPP